MRILRRLLVVLLLIAAAAVAALFAADRVVASRMLAMPFGGSLGPVEVVRGGKPQELPLAVPGRAGRASPPARSGRSSPTARRPAVTLC